MRPLDSRTKTGKVIDMVIATVAFKQLVKSNLYDLEYYPATELERQSQQFAWLEKYQPERRDILVLLGINVHREFPESRVDSTIIKVAHPASAHSAAEQSNYIEKVASLINAAINESHKKKEVLMK